MRHVAVVPIAGCWIWNGGRNFRMGGKGSPCVAPGKAAFDIFVGESDDLHPMNVCGCSDCVNPDHAVLVTSNEKKAANVRRINESMSQEERRQQGQRAGRASIAKLTREQLVAKMRAMRAVQSTRR